MALSTVVPTTVELWNRSAVSNRQSAARTNLHDLLNPPARLRLQTRLLSGSAQRAVGPRLGPPISPVPSGSIRSRHGNGLQVRAQPEPEPQTLAAAEESADLVWAAPPKLACRRGHAGVSGCSRDEDGYWSQFGSSLEAELSCWWSGEAEGCSLSTGAEWWKQVYRLHQSNACYCSCAFLNVRV